MQFIRRNGETAGRTSIIERRSIPLRASAKHFSPRLNM